MKKLLVVVTVALSIQFSYAQSEQDTNVIKYALKLELKEHIYGQLNLTIEEEKVFDFLFKEQGKVAVQKWENFDGYLKL